MPTAALIDTIDAVAAREQFVDLLCADEELVRVEFDALIAAAWGEPCVPGQRPRPIPPPAPRPPRAEASYRDDEHRNRAAAEVAPQARQRSPPRQPASLKTDQVRRG